MSYTEQLQKIGNNALAFLKKELNQKGQIIIFDVDTVSEDEDDDYYNYPSIGCISRHGHYYSYYIHKLYKKDEKYCVSGINSDTDNTDVFELNELETDELAQLADYIKSDEQHD
jgi:hypothetical protein